MNSLRLIGKPKIAEKAVIVSFLILIVIFSLWIAYYLCINDFSRETAEIVFPAVGAILLSFYLSFKSIYIDAPKPIRVNVPIAILKDRDSGMISTMIPKSADFSVEEIESLSGLRNMEHISSILQLDQIGFPAFFRATSESEEETSEERLLDYWEFAIVRWLSDMRQYFRFEHRERVYGINSGFGGGSIGNMNSQPKSSIQVGGVADEANPFLKAHPVTLQLPQAARLNRPRTKFWREMKIVTKYSSLSIKLIPKGRNIFQGRSEFNKISTSIADSLRFEGKPERQQIHFYEVQIEHSIFPLYRFSNQSSIESAWLSKLALNFEKDFSWESLRKKHLQN